tara:strand:- start:161 stop:532 length:372 start_codon:yes stop_codon:yes gene_type:complete
MEKDTVKKRTSKQVNTPNGGRGGAKPGAGRPKGSTEQVTIGGLLATLKKQANGKNYEDLLIEDFLKARNNNDSQLTVKYHNLILNKVMNTIAKIEVTDSQDQIEAKKIAFAEALAKLTQLPKD